MANSLLEKKIEEQIEIEEPRKYKRERKKEESKFTKIIKVLGFICAMFTPLYAFLSMEYIHFGMPVKLMYYLKTYTGSAIFSVLMLYCIYAVLWLIMKKGFFAACTLLFLSFLLAIGNYFKHSLTGEFVYPWDLVNQSGNVKELISFVKSGLPWDNLILVVLGIIVLCLVFAAKPKMKMRFWGRALIAIVICIMVFIPFRTPDATTATLGTFGMKRESTTTQETNHFEHGFTGGFILNTLSMQVSKPYGYGEEKIDMIMAPYEDKEATSGFNSPDIILILSESFWDPKRIPGTTFSENPIKYYDEIITRKNARSGNLYVTTMGGGTVRTEFDIITGLTVEQLPAGSVPWQYVKGNIPTYPSLYKYIGYRTVFLHTYLPSFYFRCNTYPYLGFDEMYFEEELTSIEEIECKWRGKFISDDSFVDYVTYLLDKEQEKPCFLFGISMENHQPYEDKYDDLKVEVENPSLSEPALLSMRNFTTGVYYSDKALKKLVDYIDKRKKDTLLIYFGDHLPTLGQNKMAYFESGFIKNSSLSAEDRHKIFQAPFLVYGNFDLEESDMLTKDGENEMSTYNLLNAAGEVIGAPKTAYMGFLRDYFEKTPYYHDSLCMEMPEGVADFRAAHRIFTYDILKGKQYSLKR